ncbi:short chain dehydrogenase [Streptomyces niveus]|uniref:short chain dehydrogenase n=1 Tax=Streptomyces niveus TaxID=193462 RepID=UPI003836012B
MKILVIGATGTIGGAVADALAARNGRDGPYDILRAARRSGPLRVDLTDTPSIDALLEATGPLDAIVCCAASGAMTPLTAPSDTEFWTGLDGKLIGQVNLVRRSLTHVRDGGSLTLTSGRFAEPVPGSSLGHLVNAALEAFVHAAAAEMPRGVRLNAVSPGWVRETLTTLAMDPAPGTPAADLARVYVNAVEGSANGSTLTPPTTPSRPSR